ncbi:hypothetical protein BVG16_31890 [Paenibacillus selenitireducens]|uniref:Uncharacterized protein n=1 Tax=Paenibacillus selenitireducens TaxID=1324314 RepID=A0A1T2WZ33_9BACL|nr:sigma factor [Paenibacillus selenitireducens]OPA72831.1 hypothetical protein BVG16_31890 [Paenibacillus selenitireducens]
MQKSDCQDVVQEALIKLYKKSVNGEIETNIRTYASWVIRDILKKYTSSEAYKDLNTDDVQESAIQGIGVGAFTSLLLSR